MNRYTIYCTSEQAKKALELGAPIEIKTETIGNPSTAFGYYRNIYTLPTSEQMIGWLEDLGVWIEPSKRYTANGIIYTYDIYWDLTSYIENELCHLNGDSPHFSSRKEVTLAAIDAALDYLRNK